MGQPDWTYLATGRLETIDGGGMMVSGRALPDHTTPKPSAALDLEVRSACLSGESSRTDGKPFELERERWGKCGQGKVMMPRFVNTMVGVE